MAAKYILGVLSAAFLLMGALSLGRHQEQARGQGRTWLLIGVIFGAVSAWLFVQR